MRKINISAFAAGFVVSMGIYWASGHDFVRSPALGVGLVFAIWCGATTVCFVNLLRIACK